MRKIKVGKVEVDASFDALDVAAIQAKTPKVTGRLSQGFGVNGEGDVDNPVEYADAVEFGTSETPGRFMVTQSVNEIAERLANRVAEQLNQQKILDDFEINITVK